MDEKNYLTNIPQLLEDYGLAKTLLVRHESIHLKHIMTELFLRKSVNLDKMKIDMYSLMGYLTQRMRRVYKFPRDYKQDLNKIVKERRDRFFPTLELYAGLNSIIILDFDGVCTSKYFKEGFYNLLRERHNKVVICSANPDVSFEWFEKNNLSKPNKIYACKGKTAKLNQLLTLAQRYDYTFYIDNEESYLEYAWVHGVNTWKFERGNIKAYSLNTPERYLAI